MSKRWWAGLFAALGLMVLACSDEPEKGDGKVVCRTEDGWEETCK